MLYCRFVVLTEKYFRFLQLFYNLWACSRQESIHSIRMKLTQFNALNLNARQASAMRLFLEEQVVLASELEAKGMGKRVAKAKARLRLFDRKVAEELAFKSQFIKGVDTTPSL